MKPRAKGVTILGVAATAIVALLIYVPVSRLNTHYSTGFSFSQFAQIQSGDSIN